MTRTELHRHVDQLEDARLRRIYYDAEAVALVEQDTLSDEFQLAAKVERLFWNYFSQY